MNLTHLERLELAWSAWNWSAIEPSPMNLNCKTI